MTIELTPHQQSVHDDVMGWINDNNAGKTQMPFTTLAGLAGTGKTTLLGFLADTLRLNSPGIRIAFVTYTGKASIVLGNKLMNIGPEDYVGTIHSLMYFPETDDVSGMILGWHRREWLEFDFIFVDEASMVGKEIWEDLLAYGVPIVAIGDHGQLPPIGKDNFNLMEDPEYVLTEIHRQALESPIIQLSMVARKEGWIEYGVYGNAVAKLHYTDPRAKAVIDRYNKDSDLIALCGMNKTRCEVNRIIRGKYGFKGKAQTGEKLICLKNNKKSNIMNGQLGKLVELNPFGKRFYDLQVSMDGLSYNTYAYALRKGFNQVKYDLVYAESNQAETKNALCDEVQKKMGDGNWLTYDERKGIKVDLFDFGYCISVHKSQGSEWSRVILFDERNSFQTDDDYARWLYTGITRAKEKLIMIEDF
jgi:exodeoxyribonuclease-5